MRELEQWNKEELVNKIFDYLIKNYGEDIYGDTFVMMNGGELTKCRNKFLGQKTITQKD